jgi:hypothetical protein
MNDYLTFLTAAHSGTLGSVPLPWPNRVASRLRRHLFR